MPHRVAFVAQGHHIGLVVHHRGGLMAWHDVVHALGQPSAVAAQWVAHQPPFPPLGPLPPTVRPLTPLVLCSRIEPLAGQLVSKGVWH